MSRRMSCSMTVDAVVSRTKTVTRRHVDSWKALKPGDRLTLVEKAMGLKKGQVQRVLAEVEVVDVRVELLAAIFQEADGTAAEGLGHMSCAEFVRFWANSHGGGDRLVPGMMWCRRIEWRYLDTTPADELRVPAGRYELFADDDDVIGLTVARTYPAGWPLVRVDPPFMDSFDEFEVGRFLAWCLSHSVEVEALRRRMEG